jgi:hypothetical protein
LSGRLHPLCQAALGRPGDGSIRPWKNAATETYSTPQSWQAMMTEGEALVKGARRAVGGSETTRGTTATTQHELKPVAGF